MTLYLSVDQNSRLKDAIFSAKLTCIVAEGEEKVLGERQVITFHERSVDGRCRLLVTIVDIGNMTIVLICRSIRLILWVFLLPIWYPVKQSAPFSLPFNNDRQRQK